MPLIQWLQNLNQGTVTNPYYRAIASVAPASGLGFDHWHPGDTLYCTLSVVDFATLQSVALDVAPAPSIMLLRHNPATRVIEYLDSLLAWQPLGTTPGYARAMAPSGSDPRLYELSLGTKKVWGQMEIAGVVGRAFVAGTPYVAGTSRESIGPANHHIASWP